MAAFQPRIVAFFCHWCAYRAADQMGTERLPVSPGLSPVRVPCSGRAEPEMALTALRYGADGALVVGCPPGGCHYGDGNVKALRRFTLLRALLRSLGVAPERVAVTWAAAADSRDLAAAVARMSAELAALGPIHAASDVDLPAAAPSFGGGRERREGER